MTVTQFFAILRPRLGDAGKLTYDDDELLGYLNDAVEQLSLERITAKDPIMIVEKEITPGTDAIPDGFISFAGQFPVYFAGGKIMSLDGETGKRTVRYFAVKPRLASVEGSLPFGDEAVHTLLNYALTAAAARTGADASTEGEIGQRGAEALMRGAYGIGRAVQNNAEAR